MANQAMPYQIPNLWPDNFGQPEQPTPLSILKQQGVYLGERTNNLVVGQVESIAGSDLIRHFFQLSAPLISYTHTLFVVEHHPVNLYPVEIGRRSVLPASWSGRAETPEAFLAKLKEVLNSEETKRVVQSLIAQSTS